MANNLRLISNLLYRLKRNFGLAVTFYEPTTNTYNVTTGATTRAYTEHVVRKAIVLPTRSIEFFTYTLAYIVAAKNFTYGANYDRTQRDMIVDAKDIRGFEITNEWRCSFDSKYYDIEDIRKAEDNRAFFIKVIRTEADDTI